MTALTNLTPFACLSKDHVDDRGFKGRLVVVKGIWNLSTHTLADQPGSLHLRTEPHFLRLGQLALEPVQRYALGDRLDEEVEWLPSDGSPPKPRFDFLVSGHACSRDGLPQASFHAAVRFAGQNIGLVLHAPRRWRVTSWRRRGTAEPPAIGVTRVPLHCAFAFGGKSYGDDSLPNPSGMGSTAEGADADELSLPWIEHPAHPLRSLERCPAPVGFGAWPESAAHRRRHMGTFDDTWRQTRAPREPIDFNPLFFNVAEPRLQWDRSPRAGESIGLDGLSAQGSLQVIWPGVTPTLRWPHQSDLPLRADTCIVAPDEGLYAIVWRAIVPPSVPITLRVSSRP